MSNLPSPDVVEAVIIRGDLARLNDVQKSSYYMKVCESVGLNPLTKPFEYMNLKGRHVLYATKNAAEQLRRNHKISLEITGREMKEGVYIVTAKATLPDGRQDESTGVVAVGGLKGEDLANALMKAETKAKRRVTLSACGLGMLDETEVDSIPDAIKEVSPQDVPTRHETIAPPMPRQQEAKAPIIFSPGEEVVQFGFHKGKRFRDLLERDIHQTIDFIESKGVKTQSAQHFIDIGAAYLAELENGIADEMAGA